jgi:hypothetical protein
VADSILLEAEQLINGARQNDYGHPTDNHDRTADLWRSYLRAKYDAIVPLDGEDICFLNVLQKISREMHRATRDGLVDIAGYAGNVELIRSATGTSPGRTPTSR